MTREEFKEMTPLKQIQTLTGIFHLTGVHERDVAILTDKCAVINLICRGECGEADKEFVDTIIDSMFGFKKEDTTEEVKDESKT